MNLKHLKSKNYSNESIKIKADLAGCSFDLSEQRIPKEFYDDFIKLAKEEDILGQFKKVYDGVPVNITENRSVSHFRYRDINISHEFKEHQTNLLRAAKEIRDQSFEKIIFFGIGGSQLGPAFVGEALIDNFYTKACLITGSDPDEFDEKLQDVNLEKCCFVIASKSFTTLETLNSFEKVTNKAFLDRTYAITAEPSLAEDYGIHKEKILHFDENVGGRFSIWSSISLLLAVFLGEVAYKDFLLGGYLADKDMLESGYESIIFALSCQDIFHNNILENQTSLLLNYDWKLRNFSKYAQQLEMESNGKSVDIKGNSIEHDTNSIIWGGYGPESQHSFYQLVYQGTKDFNLYLFAENNPTKLNYAQFLGQKQSLIEGASKDSESFRQTRIRRLSTILIDEIAPKSIGALMAVWENKTIINSLVWGINAFDQWGVELGKLNTKKFSSEK